MKDDVLKSYIQQFIESQPVGVPEVNFIWQGGEPTLLSLQFFETALRYQRMFQRPGMRILNSLQTNGTLLTDEKARFFAEHDFLLGISIDGPEHLHNKYRLGRNGEPTFQKVMAGIETARKHDVQFNTLTVVQNDNSHHPQEVYKFLKDIGSTFLQFIPIVERGTDDALVSPRTVSGPDWGLFINGVFDEWIKGDIGRIFVGHFDLLLSMHAGYQSSLCVHCRTCGVAPALEHTGALYACDHFVSPEFYLGNITKEGMAKLMVSKKMTQFGKDKFTTLPQECLGCEFLKFCYGACPKDRLLDATGGKISWLCSGYKAIYKHTFRYFQAMKRALDNREPASDFRYFL